MNVNRTSSLDKLDKVKTIGDSLGKALSLMTLPEIEQQMTDDQKKDAFKAWLTMYYIVESLKDKIVEELVEEWVATE
jgi:hypothetical protein